MHEFDQLFQKIEKALKRDHAYHLDAYRFVMDALHFTVTKLEKQRHVTGKELLDGIRRYALKQYGPLARSVFQNWGIKVTEDFGHIVFDLVEAGILRKQPNDKIEDFRGGYDFKDAFDKRYVFDDEEDILK